MMNPLLRTKFDNMTDVVLFRALYAAIAFTPLTLLQGRDLSANNNRQVSLQSMALVCYIPLLIFWPLLIFPVVRHSTCT